MANTLLHLQDRPKRVAKWIAILGALFLVVPVYQFPGSMPTAGQLVLPAEAAQVGSQLNDAGARDAFLAAYPVFMHPRCMNCHPVGDVPLQGEDSHLHAQSVKRGADGQGKYGMKCGACHQLTNLPGANMPPGVAHWHMPPPTMRMVFEGKSPGDLCRQLKDPQQNGGRTIEVAIEHLDADPLVFWGWAPGEGRSIPPLSHAEFVQKMHDWIAKGAACPA
jgi:hypothetical protein